MIRTIQGREVKGVVDGSGLYFSRLATAGQFAFYGGVASDSTGAIATEARVPVPYAVSPAATIVAQTRYIFRQYQELLSTIGSSLNETLQVEQYIPRKVYADGYIETSRGKGFIERGRPASALVCTGDLRPDGCVINPMGIAVIPDGQFKKEIPPASTGYQKSLGQEQFGDAFMQEPIFNEVVTAGPYVFIVGDVVLNFQSRQIEPEVRMPGEIWWGSAIRNEANFLLARLERYLSRVNSSLPQVIHSTVFLADIEDLFELDEVWRRHFAADPPARTVLPVRGLSVPRREGQTMSHPEGAIRMEHLTLGIRPGFGITREVISTGEAPLLHESEAVRAGRLLWISGQVAGGRDGLMTTPDIGSQVDFIFSRLDAICQAGGTSLQNLVRLRAFVTEPENAYVVYSALRRAVPQEPPTVAITGVPSPLPVPGSKVMMDGVAFIPEA